MNNNELNRTDYSTEKKYSMEDFRRIIKDLRSEHGCPWDKRQTHGSITLCMIEEAAEAVYGMKLYEKTKNPDSMKEELGDVLMQVVLNAQIAEEEGLFTLDDVVDGISRKMIRRHPHVFDENGNYLDGKEPDKDTLVSWKAVKEEEKRKQTYKESKWRKTIRKMFAKFYKKII